MECKNQTSLSSRPVPPKITGIHCSLDAQQCHEDCEYKTHRQDCPFATKVDYEQKAVQVSEEEETAYIPCDENDPDICGSYTSTDGQSLCYVKEIVITKKK